MVKRTTWWVFAGIFVFTFGSISCRKSSTEEMLIGYVKGIEGRSPEGRRQFIKDALQKMDVKWKTMSFDTVLMRENESTRINGENIIVSLGNAKKKIVVGAHLDAVPGSSGANDNGGGVAVVLELARTLKEMPLNSTIDLCFFDQEEVGLWGSYFYVQRYDKNYQHEAMINLDVVGSGEEVYVGPVGGGDDDRVMPFVRKAANQTRFVFQERAFYPGSDHESFANAKLENISISVVPKGDADKLSHWANGYHKFEKEEDVPEVLKVMHSENDRSELVNPKALNRAYVFVKSVLILMDVNSK